MKMEIIENNEDEKKEKKEKKEKEEEKNEKEEEKKEKEEEKNEKNEKEEEKEGEKNEKEEDTCNACEFCEDVCLFDEKNEKNEESEKKKKKKKYYNYIKYKKNFTFCEIKRHCNIDDCWVVANGNVYDVTKFIENHPGGINCILNKATNDVSVDFSFHSKYAQTKIWESLKIGRVIPCSKYFISEKKTNNCIFM
ncbi:Heme/Steroid binding domain, putative [Plasmodium yoelii yoelii]|uniref:Heme/Steroid binding domain, putative n=1 Tax=Plasmodium yoelii yoelii TaxID=73239 RepID=Q7PDN6_PLAYO|nr:Heme/Steroid binding domain, putative [Plasmodium yoelii yoelii]